MKKLVLAVGLALGSVLPVAAERWDADYRYTELERSQARFYGHLPLHDPHLHRNPYLIPFTYTIDRKKFLREILVYRVTNNVSQNASVQLSNSTKKRMVQTESAAKSIKAAADAVNEAFKSVINLPTPPSAPPPGAGPATAKTAVESLVRKLDSDADQLSKSIPTAAAPVIVPPAAPSVIQPDTSEYYLVIYKFNIPPLKPVIIGTRYGFARFECKNLLSNAGFFPSDNFDHAQFLNIYGPQIHSDLREAQVVSIFPTSLALDINREEDAKSSIDVKPEWAGVSAVDYKYERDKSDKYLYDLPLMVGNSTQYGEAAWTFYPRKAQPIMFGNQISAAILRVPGPVQAPFDSLRFECEFHYAMKQFNLFPWFVNGEYDVRDVPLANLPEYDEFVKTNSLDVPDAMLAQLNKVLKPPSTDQLLQGPHSSRDYVKGSSGFEPVP